MKSLEQVGRPPAPSKLSNALVFGWRAVLKFKHVPEQLFDLVMPLTRGGPADSSNTMVSFLYNFGITRMRVGFGSAVGVILFVICVTFAFTYKRWFMRDD